MAMFQEEVTAMNSFCSFELESIENHIMQQECRYDFLTFEKTGLFVPILSVLFFSIAGIPFNILVLYIYLKEKHSYKNDFYKISLAVLDLISLAALLPQFLMLPYISCSGLDDILKWSYLALTFFILGFYVLLVDGMTVERFIAVSKPYVFNRYQNKIRCAMFVTTMVWVLACVILIQRGVFDFWWLISIAQMLIWAIFLAGFLLPFILYPIIAYKIYKSRRNVIGTLGAAISEGETDHKWKERKYRNKVVPSTTQQHDINRLNVHVQ